MYLGEHRVAADCMTLMRQASDTAGTYFYAALKTVDDFLDEHGGGDQFSAPERFSMAMQLATLAERDFATMSRRIAAQDVADALTEVAHAVRQLAERG